jgi:arabinan endo-1,5-alpha-L-arabinosidase
MGSAISAQTLSIIRRYQFGYNAINGESWTLDIGHGTTTAGANIQAQVIQQARSPAPVHSCNTTAQVPINQWTHIAMTYSNKIIKVYINGIEVCNSTNPNITLNTQGNSGISIGLSVQANGNWSPFDGQIDDIRIYNRELSSDDVKYLSVN